MKKVAFLFLFVFCLCAAIQAQPVSCGTVDDCDDYTYSTVNLHGVCWMTKNLATESCVSVGHVYAYESVQHPDVAANVAAYGRLYDESAVMQDGSVDADGHIQGVCPDGWCLPTKEHFEYLKANYTADANSIRVKMRISGLLQPSRVRIPRGISYVSDWLRMMR